jgi:hypothetical protein
MQYSFYNYDVPNIQVINVYNCSGLGKLVFNNLSTLKVVTFDEHITFLGGSSTGNPAFKNCNNIEYISFKSTTPPTLYSNNEFSGAKQIFVPGSALNTYKNNNYFKRFASKIFAFPESISVSPLAPQLFNYGTSGASDEITIQVVPSEAEQAYSCFIDKPDGSAAPN